MAKTLPTREVWVEESLDETISLLDLAIRRSRASKSSDPELKGLIQGALEAVKQELAHLKNATTGHVAQDPGKHTDGQPARVSVGREGEQREEPSAKNYDRLTVEEGTGRSRGLSADEV